MKSILMIGMGKFGHHLCQNLVDLGNEVMIVDTNQAVMDDLIPFVTSAKIGDCTSPDVLKSLGVGNFDLCFVCIGTNFQSSLETTSLRKELGAKLVVSRAARDVQKKFLLRNGADEVVYPEKQLAAWTAIRCTSDHILDYIQLDGECSIYELTIPDHWHGKTILELDIRKKYGINILGVREGGKLNMDIVPNTVLHREKSILVLGKQKTIQKCFHI